MIHYIMKDIMKIKKLLSAPEDLFIYLKDADYENTTSNKLKTETYLLEALFKKKLIVVANTNALKKYLVMTCFPITDMGKKLCSICLYFII